MPAFSEPSRPEDIPPPTAEQRLLSAFVEAWITIHPHDVSLALLRGTANILADREQKGSVVVRLRKLDRDRARAEQEADRQAVALFRQMLEAFVARLVPGPDGD